MNPLKLRIRRNEVQQRVIELAGRSRRGRFYYVLLTSNLATLRFLFTFNAYLLSADKEQVGLRARKSDLATEQEKRRDPNLQKS